MEYCLGNGIGSDGQTAQGRFNLTHGQTDYLLSCPNENSFDVMRESQSLRKKSKSSDEVEIVTVVGGVIVGIAGVEAIDSRYKARHCAEFGTNAAKDFWGLGIRQALRTAGYVQLELSVVAENEKTLSTYEEAGFIKYGISPKGFNSRMTGLQEVIYMRSEL